MVCHHWPRTAGAPGLIVTSRQTTPPLAEGLRWSPLDDGPRGLAPHLDRARLPSALVMLAGVTPGTGVDAADLAGNRALAAACLEAAAELGIGRVLLASSSAVYGANAQSAAFAETDDPRPLSAYGRAKLEMEEAAGSARAAGLDVCALRIGNVAGADALLAPLTARAVDPASPLRIDGFADGLGPLRSYIGPASLARVLATLAIFPARLPQVLNIAAPQPVRMVALAEAAGWPHVLQPAPPGAVQSITLDCTLLNRLCPMSSDDSLPGVMVQQWKASWP